MKKKILPVVIIALIASNVIEAATQVTGTVKVSNFPKSVQTTTSRTKWQYKYISLKTLINAASERDLLSGEKVLKEKIEKALNALGNQGWELIYVGDQQYVFKRPRT